MAPLAIAVPAAGNECATLFKVEPARAVTRIIDAETIALDDGTEVRLVGTLAPRRPLTTPSDAEWPSEQDAQRALSSLVNGRSVEIAPAGRQVDRYGKRLAHVFVLQDGARFWLQGALLSRGHARAYGLRGSTACLPEMLAKEREARDARIGLWANAAYRVRSAWRTGELMRLRSTFQIVEGRVAAVAEIKGAIYLNFGTDWRKDFTAGIVRMKKDNSNSASFDAKALDGKRLRVRGWIERRNGPFIEIVDPAQIEILDRSTPATPPVAADAISGPKEKRPALPPGALDL